MLTLTQIFKHLYRFPGGAERFDRAVRVRVVNLKQGTTKSGRVRFVARTRSPESHGGRVVAEYYTTSIDILDAAQHANVSCTCDDFMYTWEWALAQRKAATLVFGNGDAPDSRNPSYTPGCCKHIVALADLLVTHRHLNSQFQLFK